MRLARQSLRKADVVVVALCTMLVMSSLAAVGPHGRRRAREAVCLSNLRQWHGFFQDYLQENDGQFFTGTTASGYWWPAQLDETTQSWRRNKTWFCPVASRPLTGVEGHVSGRIGPFAGWGVFEGPQLGPHGIAGNYGLNGYTIDISAPWGYEGGIPAQDGWRNFDSIAQAKDVPLFLDALRFDLWPQEMDGPAQNESASWSGVNMARCAINRHDGAVNCLFLDGSARKVGLKELWTLKWHRSFNTAGPWTTAGGVQAADWPEWMRDLKDY